MYANELYRMQTNYIVCKRIISYANKFYRMQTILSYSNKKYRI